MKPGKLSNYTSSLAMKIKRVVHRASKFIMQYIYHNKVWMKPKSMVHTPRMGTVMQHSILAVGLELSKMDNQECTTACCSDWLTSKGGVYLYVVPSVATFWFTKSSH